MKKVFLFDLESLTVDCVNPRTNLENYIKVFDILKKANLLGHPIHIVSSRDISSTKAINNILEYAEKVTNTILDDIINKDLNAAKKPNFTDISLKIIREKNKKYIIENKGYYPFGIEEDRVQSRESINTIFKKVQDKKNNLKPNAYGQLLVDITKAKENINNKNINNKNLIRAISAISLKAGLDKDIYNLVTQNWPKTQPGRNEIVKRYFWIKTPEMLAVSDESRLRSDQIKEILLQENVEPNQVMYYYNPNNKCDIVENNWNNMEQYQFLEANVWVNNYVHLKGGKSERIPNVYFNQKYWTYLISGKTLPRLFYTKWYSVYTQSVEFYTKNIKNAVITTADINKDGEENLYYSKDSVPIFAQQTFQLNKKDERIREKVYITNPTSLEYGIFQPMPATTSFLDEGKVGKQGTSAVSSFIHILVIPMCNSANEIEDQAELRDLKYNCSQWYNASSLPLIGDNEYIAKKLEEMKEDGIAFGNSMFDYFDWGDLKPFKSGTTKLTETDAKSPKFVTNKADDYTRTKLTNNRSENMQILQRDGTKGGWDLANVSANYIADAFVKNQIIKPKWYCGFHLSQSEDYTRRGFSVAYLHMHIINLNLLTKSGVFALQKTCPVSVIIDYLNIIK